MPRGVACHCMGKGKRMKGAWLKSYRRMTAVLAVFFILVSVLGGRGDFPFRNISSYLVIFVIIYWTMVERKRIIHRYARRFISVIGMLLLSLFVFREMRYVFIPHDSFLSRYLWYLYYLPLLMVPLYSFYTAETVGREHRERNRGDMLLGAAGILLLSGILTNDLHQQAFRFLNGAEEEAYERGWLYYAAVVWIVLLMMASFLILLHQARTTYHIRKTWLPVLLLIIATVLLIPGIAGGEDSILASVGMRIHFQDAFSFGMLSFWEACIQIGLIPSNAMYEDLFGASEWNAQIADRQGNVVYASRNATELSAEDLSRANSRGVMISDSIRLHKKAIRGGHVFWTEDMTPIQELNEELMDLAEQLSEETVILQKENELHAEKAEYEIENELYDRLNEDLQDKVRQIQKLVDVDGGTEAQYRQNLRIACVYCAYLKRRANLFLVAQQDLTVSLMEVGLSVRESLEYLKLLKVTSGYQVRGDRDLDGSDALAMYDTFEMMIEKLMPFLETCMVTLDGRGKGELLLASSIKTEKIPGGIDSLLEKLQQIPGSSCEWDDGTLFLRWKREEAEDGAV